MEHLNTCGCHSCGGPQARQDALAARAVVARRRYIEMTRGTDLRNRVVRPALYERLLIGASR